jgi:hypothetical protein
VFNATSAISWRPVLVVEEAGVPGENFSISRNVNGNDINYPFQIAIKYKSKHQGKYGASLQGQKYNVDNMVKLKH